MKVETLSKFINLTLLFQLLGMGQMVFANKLSPKELEKAIRRNYNKKLEFTGKMIEHVVAAGDSFMSISDKYYDTNQQWRNLVKANPNIDPAKLSVGQVILVPEAKLDNDKSLVDSKESEFKEVLVENKKETEEKSESVDLNLEVKVENEIKKEVKSEEDTPTALPLITLSIDKNEKKEEAPKASLPVCTELQAQNNQLSLSQNALLSKNKELEENISKLYSSKADLLAILKQKEESCYLAGDNQSDKIKSLLNENNDLREEGIKWKDKVSLLESKYSDLKIKFVDAQREMDKLKDSNEDLTNRKIASLNLQDQVGSLQKEYDELQNEYFDLKEANIYYKKSISENKDVSLKLSKAEEKIKNYETDLADLKEKLVSLQSEHKQVEQDHPLYLKKLLASAQENMIKEKTRLLTEKLWHEKNQDFKLCKVNIVENKNKDQSKNIRDFILYLNDQFGSQNVLISNSDDLLIFRMPDKLVYGVSNPKVNSLYYPQLVKITNFLNKLFVENLEIVGHSKFEFIKDESNKVIDAYSFMFTQLFSLEKYFTDELAWPAKKINLISAGQYVNQRGESKKMFEFRVKLASTEVQRSIASVVKEDKVLGKIQNEMLLNLGEPEFAKVRLGDNTLKIAMGRHYFYAKESSGLTQSGKNYVDKIMDMLVMTNDANFLLTWVPGKDEKDESMANRKVLREIASLRSYIEEKHTWAKGRLNFGFENRHHTLNDGLTYHQNKMNSRIIFEVIPHSINIHHLKELDAN